MRRGNSSRAVGCGVRASNQRGTTSTRIAIVICYIIKWLSIDARKSLRNSLEGEAYASSATWDHVALFWEFSSLCVDVSPSLLGLEGCVSLFTHLRNKKAAAEKYLARRLPGMQQALETGKSDDVFWLPGPGNPADSPGKVKRDTAPFAAIWILLPRGASIVARGRHR